MLWTNAIYLVPDIPDLLNQQPNAQLLEFLQIRSPKQVKHTNVVILNVVFISLRRIPEGRVIWSLPFTMHCDYCITVSGVPHGRERVPKHFKDLITGEERVLLLLEYHLIHEMGP